MIGLNQEVKDAIEFANTAAGMSIEKMGAQDGIEFFVSENGVWLTKTVPLKYLEKNSNAQWPHLFS